MTDYTKLDDDKFEVTVTEPSTEQFSVASLMSEIATLQSQIDARVAKIQGASAQGVAGATDAITILTTLPATTLLTSTAPLSQTLTTATL